MAQALDDVTPLVWAPARVEEFDEFTKLVEAIRYFDDPAENWRPEEAEAYFREDASPQSCLVLGWEAESVVAYAWNVHARGIDEPARVRLAGGVHPAYRHQGIGRRVLAWQIDRARADHAAAQGDDAPPLHLVAYTDEKLTSRRNMYERGGLSAERWFVDLRCALAENAARLDALLAAPWPSGVRYVPWDDAYCESCREAHNEAFGQQWQAKPVSEEAWHAQTRRDAARPAWSWLALDDDDRVIGYALNSDVGEGGLVEGWTDRLGVRPDQRGRGVATRLLAHSLDEFRRAGAEYGGLGLDAKRAGVLDLYRSVGYTATDTIVQYGLVESGRRPDDADEIVDTDEKGGDR